ncbi:MAG: hypothetical protein QOD09_2061 [Bradyrhizobium sp.]|jgi:hypothetical protein|nr:hypothetical protein [Bradyrhizobium sp.]
MGLLKMKMVIDLAGTICTSIVRKFGSKLATTRIVGGSEVRSLDRIRRMRVLSIRSVQITCFLFLLFVSGAGAATPLPLSVPIHFGKDKVVELSVELARYRSYYLDVVFIFKNDQQRAFAKEVVGAPTRSCKASSECGEASSFIITIKAGSDLILKQEKRVFGRYAFSADQFYRNILVVPLRPGSYTITVEPTEFTEKMANTHAAIELSTDARASDLE